MNIQLFLEGQEVELNKNVSFPLNKSFNNLWNPTDIIVEYSKSINIPATKSNNRLMANAYRIDRQFIINEDNPNIGMFLDPLKRIPMKLMYNGNILLDGYAKYTSATVNSKETYYTFNLYGALGDVFQSLMDCVVDENKLTDEQKNEPDGGKKYVIDCPWERYIINKDFVKNSWDTDDPSLDGYIDPYNYIGMAPAYRGLYEDFESTSIWGLDHRALDGIFPTETKSVEDSLKREWVNTLISGGYTADEAQARVDALDYNIILPNGLSEHNMRQFRSYEQKPYIYINGLFSLFQRKCSELTGYTINLDSNWFNVNNPYYSRLCYMLDYLSVRGNTLQSSLPFTGYTETKFKEKYCNSSATYNITDSAVLSKGNLTIDPFTLGLRVITGPVPSTCVNAGEVQINITNRNCVTIDIAVTTGGNTTHHYFWGGTGTPNFSYANAGPCPDGPLSKKYPEETYIYMTEDTTWDKENNRWVYMSYLTTKSFEIEHNPGDSISITYNLQFHRAKSAGDYYGWSGTYLSSDGNKYGVPVFIYDWGTDRWANVVNSERFMFIVPNITYNSNWRTTTTCELRNLYTKDEPLFNVILQYTKMFGLIWKPDYNKKTIDIMTRRTYFKDYDVVDWSDKVDKSKGMTIEPVSFSSKYVTFNYDDVQGYRYSGYRNKYGVDYGEKKLKTKYNFDTKEEKLFKEKIGPSSVSCKSFPYVEDLRTWTTLSKLPTTTSEVNFIDCENEEETSAISLNNWYFRLPNKSTNNKYYISDVSNKELELGKYFWISNEFLSIYSCGISTYELPQFSPAFKSDFNGLTLGCLFNCPNEDYTEDKKITEAKGNYIYDICWSDYINERYNANNKKVTCYVKINPIEFEQFNFKTFVTIDNQLFVVNKIVDYDVNSNTTKCELVQVSDPSGYTRQKVEFPYIIYSEDEIHMTTKTDDYGTSASAQFKVQCWPSLSEMAFIEAVPISVGSPDSHIIEIEPEYYGNYVTNVSFWYESSGTYTEEWELQIKFDNGDIKKIPVYING